MASHDTRLGSREECDAFVDNTLEPLAMDESHVDASTFYDVPIDLDEHCPTTYTSTTAWDRHQVKSEEHDTSSDSGKARLLEVLSTQQSGAKDTVVSALETVCEGTGGPNVFNWDWSLDVGSRSIDLGDPKANGEWGVVKPDWAGMELTVLGPDTTWSQGKYKTAFGSAKLGFGNHPYALGPGSEAEVFGMEFVGWGSPEAECADAVSLEICSPSSWPTFTSEPLVETEDEVVTLSADGFLENVSCQDP